MLSIRAVVYFERQVGDRENGLGADFIIDLSTSFLMRLDSFCSDDSYEFVEYSPLMLDDRCDVSVEHFLSLVGHTHEEAYDKFIERFPNFKTRTRVKEDGSTYERRKPLQQTVVLGFYEALKTNELKKVTLQIYET